MGRLIDEDSLKFTNFEIVMCEGDFKQAFKLLCEKLDNAPTVDAEPVRHGRWVYKKNMGYFCSACMESGLSPTNADDNCGYSLDGTMKYCWNCGAKMETE